VKLTLSKKLFGGFGLVAALLVVVAITAMWGMGRLSSATHDITNRVSPKVAAAEQVRYAAADLNGWQTAYVLDKGKSRPAYQKSDAVFKKSLVALDKQSNNARDNAAVAQIRQAYNRFANLDTTLYAAVKQGNQTEAQRIALGPEITAFNAISNGADAFVAQAHQEEKDSAAKFNSERSSTTTMMIVIALLALALAAGTAFLIVRGIKRGVAVVLERLTMLQDHCATDLRAGLEAMSDGDLTNTVTPVTPLIENPGPDEIGDVARAVNGIRDRTVASVEAFNAMAQKLSALIGNVSGSASSVSSASQQMASTSEEAGRAVGEIANAVGDVAQGAERQVRQVESVRGSAEEAATAAATSAEQAQEAAKVAEQAREVARDGVGAAEEATEAMRAVRDSSQSVSDAIRQLAGKSEAIGAIVETITGIAGQTNLLALNAAIEAARAGEQGRGFAVVAEEVRKLAEESQQAAEEISSLIEQIQSETTNAVGVVEDGAQRTEQGADTVEQTRAAFVRIGEAVEDVNERIAQIAGAAEQISSETAKMQGEIAEVAAVAEQSSASTEEVSASTEQTSASTQEIAASAQELASTAGELEALVATFKVRS
jgi:methyl-accepting chemotaxis protein